MKAPFPWFGGKSRVAHLVWDRFGNVPNYVEPFAGSLAVLLARPHPPKIETVNDLDCYLANFWRAIKHSPAEVVEYADWPVNETDLRARHIWLVQQEGFRDRMRSDPDYFDAKIAGWWAWGVSQWIGSGWCSKPEWEGRGNGSRAPRGIHGKRPHLGRGFKGDIGGVAIAVADQIPDIAGDGGAAGRGIHASGRRQSIQLWFNSLSERLRHTRVCCGEWGYGSQGDGQGRKNASRERIWFSPHCLKPPSLFASHHAQPEQSTTHLPHGSDIDACK